MMYIPTPVAAHEENMHDFLREVRAIPLLSAEQEQELAVRCGNGDEEAIRLLVQSNLRLVISVAKEYGGRGAPMLDLIQEGCIGLLAAAKKYDYTKDCRFATYAVLWIRQSMTRFLENQGNTIRVPAYTAELLRRIDTATNRLRQTLDREPTEAQIAAACDLDEEKLHRLQQLRPQTFSLDAPAGEADRAGMPMEDMQTPQPQELLIRRALTETMEKLLSMLTERQAQVLRLHYGMEDGKSRSFEQIGRILGVSKERARQIEKQAMERLKALGADFGLEDFLE